MLSDFPVLIVDGPSAEYRRTRSVPSDERSFKDVPRPGRTYTTRSADEPTSVSVPRPRVAMRHSSASTVARYAAISSRAGTRLGSSRVVTPARIVVAPTRSRRTRSALGSNGPDAISNPTEADAVRLPSSQVTTCRPRPGGTCGAGYRSARLPDPSADPSTVIGGPSP